MNSARITDGWIEIEVDGFSMGIRLDWDIESENDQAEVGEDPQARASRVQVRRYWLYALGVVLLLIALASGGITHRLQQVDEQITSDLEVAVAAETLALRIGDRQAFLAAQADEGEWLRIQSDTFDEYQALGERITTSGEVLDWSIEGDLARVTLRETLDEQPYRVVWFYERRDGIWVHIPSRPDFWGEQLSVRSTHLDIAYRTVDQPLIDHLVPQMDAWWEIAWHLTDSDPGLLPRPRIQIVYNPLVPLGWAAYDSWTLLIPSPLLNRVPEDGSVDAGLLRDVAGLIAERMAETKLAGCDSSARPDSDLLWMQDELATWLRSHLDYSAPPSGFLKPLAASYGLGFVPTLSEAICHNNQIVPVVQSLTGISARDLAVAWDNYFEYRLRAESRLFSQGLVMEANLLFRDPESFRWSSPVDDFPTERRAVAESIRVLGVQRVGDIFLAKVHFTSSDLLEGTGTDLIVYEPFRLAGDRWVHTALSLADWGESSETSSQHFTLTCYDLDAPLTQDLLSFLESVFEQATADLAIEFEGMPTYYVSVTPLDPLEYLAEQSVSQEGIFIPVLSPYAAVHQTDVNPRDYIRLHTAHLLVQNLVTSQIEEFPQSHPLARAFVRWELERNGVLEAASSASSQVDNIDELPTLESLWSDDPIYAGADSQARYTAAFILIDLLVDTYGVEALHPLLRNLSRASNVDDWLYRSLGIHTQDIEETWRMRLLQPLSEQR